MKISTYFLFAYLFFFQIGNLYSSTPNDSTLLKKRISLITRNAEIIDVIHFLEQKYQLNFSFGNQVLFGKGNVTITANRLPLNKVLEKIFLKKKLSYKLIGKHVVIFQDTTQHITENNDVQIQKDSYSENNEIIKSQKLPNGFVFSSRSMRKYQKYLKKLTANTPSHDTSFPLSDTSHIPQLNRKGFIPKNTSMDFNDDAFYIGAAFGLRRSMSTAIVRLNNSADDKIQLNNDLLLSANIYIQLNLKNPFFFTTSLRYDPFKTSGSLVKDTILPEPKKATVRTVNFYKSLHYLGITFQAGMQVQQKNWRFAFTAGLAQSILIAENFLENNTKSKKVDIKSQPPPPPDSTGGPPKPIPENTFANRKVETYIQGAGFVSLFEANVHLAYTLFKNCEIDIFPTYVTTLTSILKHPQGIALHAGYFEIKLGVCYKFH